MIRKITNKAFIIIKRESDALQHNELYKKLSQSGCMIYRHGGSHDIWINPVTGARAAVPRHGTEEVKKGTLRSILKKLGV